MEKHFEHTKLIDPNKLFRFELKFFKLLQKISKSTKVYLNIPETIIFGFGFKTSTLICSDFRTGELIIKENLTPEAINACFELFSVNSQEGIPIALWKVSEQESRDKCRPLFSYEECCFNWNYNKAKGASQAIQKFIRTNPINVLKSEYSQMCKVRTKTLLYRKKVRKNFGKSFIIKKNMGRVKFLLLGNDECEKIPVSVNHVENKMIYLVYLIEKYFIKDYSIKILQTNCNWIQDFNGKTYFINMKEYKITSNSISKAKRESLKLSTTLPMLKYIKKIKDAQDKSQSSFLVNNSLSSSWKDF